MLTHPWLTLSCREMSQGRTPWWAMSTMRCRITSGSGRPLTNIPPSWLRPPWPGGGGGMNTHKCHGTWDIETSRHHPKLRVRSWKQNKKSSYIDEVIYMLTQFIDTPAVPKQTHSSLMSGHSHKHRTSTYKKCMFQPLTYLMLQVKSKKSSWQQRTKSLGNVTVIMCYCCCIWHLILTSKLIYSKLN